MESATPGLEGPLPPLKSATLPLRGAAKPLGIATEPLEETLTPAAKKMILLSTILDWAEGGDFCGFALEDLPSGVCGTVFHHNDFVGNASEGKLKVQVLDGGGDAPLLVPRGDDNREQRERAGGGLKSIQNSAKLVDFFGFQQGVVADVEAVEVDMLDLGEFLYSSPSRRRRQGWRRWFKEFLTFKLPPKELPDVLRRFPTSAAPVLTENGVHIPNSSRWPGAPRGIPQKPLGSS